MATIRRKTTDLRDGSPRLRTDYAYDAYGNEIASALPFVATSAGSFRPTSYYSYYAFNNVTAYCDPVASNTLGLNWTSAPAASDTLCPNSSATHIFTFTYHRTRRTVNSIYIRQRPI
jgi:hypothetical protein